MSNLLQNPAFRDWQQARNHYFEDASGKQLVHEYPAHWDFITIPKESDPNKVPQTFHRDNGFVISASYLEWEAGWRQSNVRANPGRYRARARIKADVNFPDHNIDRTAITWRFTLASNEGNLEQDWRMTSQQQLKQIEYTEFVFELATAQTLDLTFWGRSFYAGNDCDFWIYEIILEPVSADYGGSDVPRLGTAVVQPPMDVTPIADSPTEVMPREEIDKAIGEITSGKSLGAVTTLSEIDQIVAGLRALANQTSDPTAKVGINTLADALTRLK